MIGDAEMIEFAVIISGFVLGFGVDYCIMKLLFG